MIAVQHMGPGLTLRATILIVGFSWMLVGAANEKDLAQAIEDARVDLSSGDWQDARDELTKAAAGIKNASDEKLYGDYLFYSALTQQQRGDDVKLGTAERAEAKQQSVRFYKDFLIKHPNSGGALNNLAQLYAQEPQQYKQALELFDRAIQQKDGRAGVYGVNRAKLLVQMGDVAQALKWSREAASRDRSNEAAHVLTLELLRKNGDARVLADYLRELDKAGQVQRALDTGMSEIEQRNGGREPILVAMAEVLADPAFGGTPDRFLNSPLGNRLSKRVADNDIGLGVRELFQLYTKPADPRSLNWWRADFIDYDELRAGSRSAALLNLARSLGDRCRLEGKERYSCAEAYYRFAIDFTGSSADPSAFLSLAEIMVNTGRIDELKRISQQYEQALFRGKMTAYDQNNQPRIYEFHLALGMMYGYMEKWTDPQFEPGGAIWQLNRAQETATKYSAQVPEERKIELPPQAVTLLSDGYLKTGAVDTSVKVRAEAAEKYIRKGDKERAQEVLDADWRKSLPNTVSQPLRARIDRAVDASM